MSDVQPLWECRRIAGTIVEVEVMKLFIRSSLVVALGTLAMTLAQAEEREHPGACREDVQKLCKGTKPGGGRIVACLKQHEAELSAGCKEKIAEAKEEGKEFHEACKADVDAQCKGVQPGQGRIARCLEEHKDKLAPACKEKMREAEKKHPCMEDMEKLCKDIKPGDGRMMQCMKEHEAQLSPACKEHHHKERDGDRKK
jgi:hypothetical protein